MSKIEIKILNLTANTMRITLMCHRNLKRIKICHIKYLLKVKKKLLKLGITHIYRK